MTICILLNKKKKKKDNIPTCISSWSLLFIKLETCGTSCMVKRVSIFEFLMYCLSRLVGCTFGFIISATVFFWVVNFQRHSIFFIHISMSLEILHTLMHIARSPFELYRTTREASASSSLTFTWHPHFKILTFMIKHLTNLTNLFESNELVLDYFLPPLY